MEASEVTLKNGMSPLVGSVLVNSENTRFIIPREEWSTSLTELSEHVEDLVEVDHHVSHPDLLAWTAHVDA
jgi:hypothetical protein